MSIFVIIISFTGKICSTEIIVVHRLVDREMEKSSMGNVIHWQHRLFEKNIIEMTPYPYATSMKSLMLMAKKYHYLREFMIWFVP